jgi:hypothetical protein
MVQWKDSIICVAGYAAHSTAVNTCESSLFFQTENSIISAEEELMSSHITAVTVCYR